MDLQNQRTVLEILDQVLHLPPEAQSAFLDKTCGAQTELRREIEACIEADTSSWVRLQKFREGPSAQEWLGPYQLKKSLGEGGMGLVFLAERADGTYNQAVAIKILKASMNREALFQRFLAERQILAQLHHPHIAKLLDGGTTEEGLPYLVMEYVEGKPITQYCSDHNLSLGERLELFLTVCKTIAYAQSHLIIHRDIKPSNVLVTANGQPMLLDFGIAKLLRPSPLSEATRTVTENRLMTPVYASPEQLSGSSITTATDVYGLGLLLFELLAGERPFELENRPIQEVCQTICETQPRKPSTVITAWHKQNQSAAANHILFRQSQSNHAKKWAAALKGDLDSITLKALRKDASERYGSAAALAEDLERHLQSRPVQARKENLLYVSKKFFMRNRPVFAVASLFLLLGVGFTANLFIQRNTLRAERARVLAERDKAQDMMGYLITLFSIPNTSQHDPRMTVDELLQQGVAKIQSGSYAPTTQADLITTMGVLYRGLGQYERSEKLLKEGLNFRQASQDARTEDRIQSMNELTKLHLAKGEFGTAKEVIQGALPYLEQLPEDSPLITQTYTAYSQVMKDLGDYPNAELYAEKALYLQRQHLETDHPHLAQTLNRMAEIQHVQGDLASALAQLNEALLIAQKRSGENPGLPFEVILNMASVYQTKGDYQLARDAYLQVLAWQKKTLGNSHPEIALTLHNLGTLYQDMGQYQLAEDVFLQSLEMIKEIHGTDSPFIGNILYSLSNIYYWQDRFEKAEANLIQVIEIDSKALGENHINLAYAFGFLASVQVKKSDHEQAHVNFQKALTILSENLGESHEEFALMLGNFGDALKRAGHHTQAEHQLRRSLAIFETNFGRNHLKTAYAMDRLASFLDETPALDEAEKLFREACGILEVKNPTDRLGITSVKKRLAECLALQGRFVEAEPLMQEAYQFVGTMDGPLRDAQLKFLLEAMVGFYEKWGKERKVAFYKNALIDLEQEKTSP